MSALNIDFCGTGGWNGPKPGDPNNDLILRATPAFGGIDVTWTYPSTNPHAVAYVILYAASSANFTIATELAKVPGTFFYDKRPTGSTFFYWIQTVSVNGTIGALVGPASAQAKPLIQEMIELLSGQINASELGIALRQDIDKITLTRAELTNEIASRLSASAALSQLITNIESGLVESGALINQEINTRVSGQNVLANQINVVAALNRNNTAAIVTEQTARVTADSAMAIRVDTVAAVSQNTAAALMTESLARSGADNAIAIQVSNLNAASDNNAAAVRNVSATKIGYSALSGGTTPFDGNGSTVVYPVGLYPSSNFPEYATNRTRIIDKLGVDHWNASAAGSAKPLVWLAGLPLATAIKTVQVTDANGGMASLEQSFIAQKDLNNGFKSMYTMRLSVNGLIGGFGVYNNGQSVEANFDVDRFSVGRTVGQSIKPFIVDNNGIVFIDQGAIRSLTFNKLRDESGSFIVENGKVKANYIDTNGLIIRDTMGNPIFGSGIGLNWDRIVGATKPENNANRTVNTNQLTDGARLGATAFWDSVSGLGKPENNADVTRNNTALGIVGQGTLAKQNAVRLGHDVQFADGGIIHTGDLVSRLSKINQGTISTFMDGAAITSAYIGNAQINNAHIQHAAVQTLSIAGYAVTVPLFAGFSSGVFGQNSSITSSQFLLANSSLIVICTYSTQLVGSFFASNVVLFVCGPTGETQIGGSGQSAENFSSGAASAFFTAPVDGFYYVVARVNGQSGGTCTNCSITALGSKK